MAIHAVIDCHDLADRNPVPELIASEASLDVLEPGEGTVLTLGDPS